MIAIPHDLEQPFLEMANSHRVKRVLTQAYLNIDKSIKTNYLSRI